MVRRIGRNDPCHCGSGLKLKRCHKIPRRVSPVKSKAGEPEIDRMFREKYNEIIQDSRHFSSDLVPFIVKNRMRKWFKSLISERERT